MCGITAYLGTQPGFTMVYQGIEQLQNRGYDSCGIASIKYIEATSTEPETNSLRHVTKTAKIEIQKFASQPDLPAVQRLANYQEQLEGHCLIAHTRWSTHGRISDRNAHPHQDQTRHLALVHNGIIENYNSLKQFLIKHGYQFESETDTEVIVQLISYYRETTEVSTEEALQLATQKLEGTWGVVLIDDRTPRSLYLAKNGSPLLVGYEENLVLVASETAGLAHAVHDYFNLRDHQILKVELVEDDKDEIDASECETSKKYSTKIKFWESPLPEATQTISHDAGLIKNSPAPYEHWMLKEIVEQEETVARVLNHGGRLEGLFDARLGGLETHCDDLLKIQDLVILGCGTSYHAGLLGAHYLKYLDCFRTVQVIDASEFNLNDLPKSDHPKKTRRYDGTGLLVLSQSGETKDVHRAMELVQDYDIPIFSIVNVVESLIARQALCGVYLNAGREVAVASTKSFTSQILALILVGVWFAGHRRVAKMLRGRFINALRALQPQAQTLISRLPEVIPTSLIERLSQSKRIFILGRGVGYPLAQELALKIKEVSYIQAESYPGGGLKHGPFALIESGTPIILISTSESTTANKMDLAAIETKTRGAWTIGLTTRTNLPDDIYDDKLYVASEYLATDPILLIIVGRI